jgi:Rod binding domain-containing protein
MGGKDSFMSAGSELYKHHITDTLSKELANQGSLGIAELIQKYKK